MNRYVRVRYKSLDHDCWFQYVDSAYIWTAERADSENRKAVEIAKMAFLDHGKPLIPVENLDSVLNRTAPYLDEISRDTVLLVRESGTFMTLTEDMTITESVYSEFYPIKQGSAIVCENDPFPNGYFSDYSIRTWCDRNGVKDFHVMWSFRCRTESEIIDAFRNTPAILFSSSFISVDWWELMLRCVILSKTKATIVSLRKPSTPLYPKFIEMASRVGIEIQN